MQILMSYGREGVVIEAPDGATVLRTKPVPWVPDEPASIRRALTHPIHSLPLSKMVRPGMRVVVTHSDITRATPNDRLLPVILHELEANSIRRDDITLLNALGTHRKQTAQELRHMLGDWVVDNYRCEQHDATHDHGLVSMGTTSFGHPIRLNRTLMEADVKILTGFIEPHFFAGFSGGPKAVLPALAGAESVFTNHSYPMISDPRATFNVTHSNPIWEEMKEMASQVENTFLVNVTLNQSGQITGVFAGDVIEAHSVGCDFLRQSSLVTIPEPFDVVVTSNSGYPLDQNLYQCVKGLAIANRAVRQGGAILMVARCEDGLPEHGAYATLLQKAGNPENILKMVSQPGFQAQDAWQVLIQANIQQHAEVHVFSEGLSDAQIHAALMQPCHDITATIQELTQRLGKRVGILPEGPLVIIN